MTLFDITKTNVISRRHAHESRVPPEVAKQRSQQSNFETILQIISIRTQPENITEPEKSMVSLKNSVWGNCYTNKTKIPVWQFIFTVSQDYYFNDGESNIGNLLKDSHGIPMITGLDEFSKIKSTVNISEQYKNIHFEVLPDDDESN